MQKPKVLLADDHSLIVAALGKLLEPEFEIVGTVSDGRELLLIAPKLKPDVVVIDLSMPSLNGMDAGQQLKKAMPLIKLIVLTMSENSELAAHALAQWASGYLLKKSAGPELVIAIRDVLRGKPYVTPKMAQGLAEEFVRNPRPDHVRTLTSRQREVLQLVAEGHTIKEIGTILHIAPRTAAFHKYRIMENFGIHTSAGLVRFAIDQKVLIEP
ncbi:response regulator transcription factor [Acidobacterium sp. S8]|uniref:response regulator n=1 Tax=Acidobacterium sp. S8 TaxID=1641854 RepID=UPI00131B4CE1|nr:response regulator transcription factor [Acidobacterium sp. S8]